MKRPRRRNLLILLLVVAALAIGWLVFKRLSGDDKRGGGGRPAQVTVATAPVQVTTLTRAIEGVGDVLAADAVTITAETAARVAAIEFNEGQQVRQGAVLVRFDAAQEAADVRTREAEAAELRGRLARLQSLVDEGAIPRGQVEDLRRTVDAARARTQSARTLLDDTVIRAPFSGTVGLRQISVGSYVTPGTEVTTLDRIDSVRVRFTVPETALGRLRVGAPIEVRSSAFGDQVFRGTVRALAGRLDPNLRTLAAEAELRNPGRLLRPGMLANVRLATETVEAVVVPPIALQVRGPTHFVYRIVQGCALRTEVVIGERRADGVEVLSGLKRDDRVATEGFDNLSTGTPVIDKRDRARGGRPGGPSGGQSQGEPSDEQKKRDAQLKQRCQQVARQAGGTRGG